MDVWVQKGLLKLDEYDYKHCDLAICKFLPSSTTRWFFWHQVPKPTIHHQNKVNARTWGGPPTWINEYQIVHCVEYHLIHYVYYV
jgi:hypothetical protein